MLAGCGCWGLVWCAMLLTAQDAEAKKPTTWEKLSFCEVAGGPGDLEVAINGETWHVVGEPLGSSVFDFKSASFEATEGALVRLHLPLKKSVRARVHTWFDARAEKGVALVYRGDGVAHVAKTPPDMRSPGYSVVMTPRRARMVLYDLQRD